MYFAPSFVKRRSRRGMPVRVRRCATVMFEPCERVEFSFESIVSGGAGLQKSVEWIALIPHHDAETVVDAVEIEMLGAISPSEWIAFDELKASHSPEAVD